MGEQRNLINFKMQIEEDIHFIRDSFMCLDNNLNKDSYGFLYWILTKIYNEDENNCIDLITEFNDKGNDAYIYFEETKELFLLQGKYYSIDDQINTKDVCDFFLRPKAFLDGGNYTKSPKLQKIYSKLIADNDAHIYFHFYSTSLKHSNDVDVLVHKFNEDNRNSTALVTGEFFDLAKIYKKYYGTSYKETKQLCFEMGTVNKGTVASLREEYNISNLRCETYYVITPITEIYRLRKEAEERGYSLFEENIRDYLGESSVNRKIIDTLKDPKMRNNFLFYNNGITLIASKAYKSVTKNARAYIPFQNPQIVNGCQTVNSIFTVLDSYNEKDLENEFSGAFVMVKALIISSSPEDKEFYKQVVQYTNSQNAVPDKVLNSNDQPIFIRLQKELYNRGLFVKVKQSDKYKFSQLPQSEKSRLVISSKKYAERAGYDYIQNSDISIDLDKFLQIMLTFRTDASTGYQKKSQVLKKDSNIFKNYSLELTDTISYDNMLYLYYFYKRALKDQQTDKTKNANYVISFILYYLKKNCSTKSINQFTTEFFSLSREKIDRLYEFMQSVSVLYFKLCIGSNSLDYNSIIKAKVDESKLEMAFSTLGTSLFKVEFEFLKNQ